MFFILCVLSYFILAFVISLIMEAFRAIGLTIAVRLPFVCMVSAHGRDANAKNSSIILVAMGLRARRGG